MSMLQPLLLKKLKQNGSMKTYTKRKKKKRLVLFIIGGGNTKKGSQKIPGITGKFGLGV